MLIRGLIVVVGLTMLAGCGGGEAGVAADPEASPAAADGRVGTLTAPAEALAVLPAAIQVDQDPVDLGFALPVDDPAFVYLSAVTPEGPLTLSCVTTGSAGTITLQLDADGTLSLLQDTGSGPQVVDSDTLAERDRHAPGEEVVLALACGSDDTGRSQALLSVDSLGIQVVDAEGDVGDQPYRVTASSQPATTIETAFVIPAREVLGQ